MNTDDKIRAILQMEAEAVEPSPAGFDAIREGIARRRTRSWWIRGSAFAGVGLTTAAAIVLLASNPTPQTINQPPASSDSATPTTEPTPTGPVTTTSPAPPLAPSTALGTIWPLTTQGEVDGWHANPDTYPALKTAAASAKAFANNYLLAPYATVVAAGEKDGDLYFDVTNAGAVITRLEVRGFGDAGRAPYLVTRATSEAVKISSPLPETKITSPLRANGDVHEVEPRVNVRLRADGPGSAPIELGDVYAVNNAPNVWQAEIGFATTSPTGSVMVTIASPRGDGTLSAAAVIPLTFTTSTGPPAGDVFAAIRDERLALFEPDGTFIRYLTEQQPGSGAQVPDVSPDGTLVAWSQGTGTCSMTGMYVPVAGGDPVTIGDGTGVTAWPTWVGNGRIAYSHTTCDGATTRTTLNLFDVASRRVTTLTTLADQPAALGASPDGKHLAYVVGNTLTTYEIGTGAKDTVPVESGCRWRAVDVIGTSTVGQPILITGSTCEREAGFLVDRFATNAPERERVTERKADSVVYRLSYDEASNSVLISHGLEDGEPYVELTTANGDLKVLRGMDQAAW